MSLKDEFNVNHNRYNNAIHDLFQSLDLTLQNKPGTTPVEIMKELIQIDIELKETMKRIKEHQEIQTINEQLESEILKSKTCITESVASMDKMGNEMQALLKEAKKSLNSYQNGINCEELLKYAQRIASHTLDPLQPPIPQESAMRMSILYNLGKETTTDLPVAKEEVVHVVQSEQESESDASEVDLDLF